MEENSELEEGEACCYKDDDHMDPDIAFSHIDERIQSVLGHFQKDFEGRVSVENLGAKFGGYGSFLPAYECSPSTLSHPKTPQGPSTPKSTNNLALEGALQSSKTTSNIPLSVKPGTAAYNDNSLQRSVLVPGDASVKRVSDLSSSHCALKSNLEGGNSHKSGNPLDQRTLKVRLKVGSDKILQKSAAIYSGLGLDNSPSSSLGNSSELSGEMLPVSQCTASESPTSILQVMTSLPSPGGILLSPLHESLLCLIRKETKSRDKTVSTLNVCQAHSPLSVEELINIRGSKSLSKEAKLLRKSGRPVELKHESSASFENGIIERNIGNDAIEDKDNFFTNLKHLPLSNVRFITGPSKAADRVSEVAFEDGVRDRFFSSDLAMEDSLESISGQESGKSEKNAQICSGEKILKHNAVRGSSKGKSNKISASSKAYPNASQSREDVRVGSMAASKQKIGQQSTFNARDEANTFCGKGKPLLEGKKSRRIESSQKSVAVSTEESLKVGVNVASTDTTRAASGVSMSKDKVPMLKLEKDGEVNDNRRESSELKTDLMGSLERPSDHLPKDSSIDILGMQQNASSNKLKERSSGKRHDNQSTSRESVNGAAYLGPCVAENVPVSEVVLPAVDQVVIEENWVCCDSCQKWRLLPFGTKPEQLPEKWLCRMQNWLSGMNRCDVSEEETTRALNALYQLPVVAGQTTGQNYTNGSASGVQHINQKLQILDSVPLKKCDLNEIAKAVSSQSLTQTPNSSSCHLQECAERLRLNDMSELPSEPNLFSEKHLTKQKEGYSNIGKSKQLHVKGKRESDQHVYRTAKKTKTEELCNSDKRVNTDMELENAGLRSKGGLVVNASRRNMKESKEYSFLEDVSCDAKERSRFTWKKQGGQTQFVSDGVSSHIGKSDKRDTVMKKSKLKEWQDNQNLLESSVDAEESSESELKKVKKLRASKSLANEDSTISGSDRLDRKSSWAQVVSLASKEQPIDAVEEIRSTEKEVQPCKNRKRLSSQQFFEDVDSYRKDARSGEVSMAATSSSSKVSGSLKMRATLDEMKGSPVESVSSSPLKTLYRGKLTSVRGDLQGKGDAVNGGLPETGKLRCWNGEADGEINQSVAAMSEKVPGCSYAESAKNFSLNDWDVGANHRIGGKTKTSSGLVHGNSEILKHCLFSGADRANQGNQENELISMKSGTGLSLQSKHNNRSSASVFDRDNTNIADPAGKQRDLCLLKSSRHDVEMGPKSHEPLSESMSNAKCSISCKSITEPSKDKKGHANKSDAVRQRSKDRRLDDQVKLEDYDVQGAKLGGLCSSNKTAAPQQYLIQDFKGESKANKIQKEPINGSNKLFLHLEVDGRQECYSLQSDSGYQQGGAFDGLHTNASGNADVTKVLGHHGDVDARNRAGKILAHHASDLKGARDLNAPSPERMNPSGQTASNALKKAQDLRDYADRIKSSGFDFESNEVYFQAALKFLRGASLLETFNNESDKQGEMTRMELYVSSAKICESCALEYEKRSEMAAAALAYKCMEVAYLRVISCRTSSSSKDWNELQLSFQRIPQGESPSSSVSDVDNLNNQTTVDKASLSKGTVPHVAGNPAIVARSHTNLLRLFDFTQNVYYAMEASRKSQNAFLAANIALKEAQNKDCISSMRKVIDFSYQDVEGFVRLVQLAMEVNSPGFTGAKD